MLFYIGALALCCAAFIMIRQAAMESKRAVAVAQGKARLRLVGRLLLGIATSFAGTGVLAQAIAHSH